MQRGPKGEKRPANIIARSVMIAQIATGEIEDTRYEQPNRVKGGKAGGKACAEKLTAEEKQEIARKAAKVRFENKGGEQASSNKE